MTRKRVQPHGFPYRRLFQVLAAAGSLLLACSAVGADESAPVPRPDVKVAEWWRYRVTEYPTNVPRITYGEQRVTFVGPNEILTVNRADKDSVWTPEWNALSHGSSGVTYDKPRQLLRFPLTVGAAHQAKYEVVSRRGSGALSRYEDNVKVVGWEDVAVPAGRFRALKLEVTGTYQRLDTRGRGWTRKEIWYVPEVKRWVKWTHGETWTAPNAPIQMNVEELTGFKVEK